MPTIQPDNEYILKKVNGWNEWAHCVLGDIEHLFKNDDKCDEEKEAIKKTVNQLILDFNIFKTEVNTRAGIIGGIWGAVVGIIAGVITGLIINIFTKV